jgi:hypothetical protein
MRIKIFGERNTGTNVLREMILRNSASAVLPGTVAEADQTEAAAIRAMREAGASRSEREARIDAFLMRQPPAGQWKHRATDPEDLGDLPGDVHVLMTFRHPLSWLLSLHRNRQDRLSKPPDDFLEFLRFEWPLLGRDRLEARALTPPGLYEAKLAAHRRLADFLAARGRAPTLVRFEEIVEDQGAVFERLRPWLDRPNARFEPIEDSTKDPAKNAAHYRAYYAGERWREALPPGAEALVRIDPDLLDWAGYGPVEDADRSL